MYNFCTLFDSHYLSRGLAMYYSLEQWASPFHLYIFAFDDRALEILRSLRLRHATIISLGDFEDEALLSVKADRTRGEYCWTCTPSTLAYCLKTYNLSDCTYLDADLMFYADPAVLVDELGADSILITEHRYAREYDQSETSGRFCVQFMTFRNNAVGWKALNWWREACIEWCYARLEDGKFGDQKYLDDWPERFDGVHVLDHEGGGVAPWNVSGKRFLNDGNGVWGLNETGGERFRVVFYHFHGLRFLSGSRVNFSDYHIGKQVSDVFYRSYTKRLLEIETDLAGRGIALPSVLDQEVGRIGNCRTVRDVLKKMIWKSTTSLKTYHPFFLLRTKVRSAANIYRVPDL